MADDDLNYGSNKRRLDGGDDSSFSPPRSRRATGFSSAPLPEAPAPATGGGGEDGILLAKQRAQEIAARIFSNAEANRPKSEDNGGGVEPPFEYSQKPMGQPIHVGMTPPSSISAYGYQGPSKKIEIPNGKVGVIIGKGGETIKYLQSQSGAKIQVTRDMDADPYSQTRMVELVGNSEQINKAEELIKDVLAEAEAGGSGVLSARKVGIVPSGADQFSMKVPNNKVGLIIGKGGETIKTMQAKSGARIQVIPLHLPPGDTSQERTVQIDGTNEQIEVAKQLVIDVTSNENRMRNPSMSGGYSQQGYQQPRQPNWGPPGAPQMQQQQQQPAYGYAQPGAYPSQPPQYNTSQPAYGGYPSYPDQSSNQQTQQTAAGTGYDYYSQQQQQPGAGSAAPADSNTYGYAQPPPAYSQPTGQQQQGYGQESYAGGYYAQPGYSQPAAAGYDYQQGYTSTPGYPSQDGSAPSQQAVPPVQASTVQQGYNGQPPSSSAVSYPSQPSLTQPTYGQPPQSQQGYAQPPAAQSGYAQVPPSSGYGLPQGQAGYGAYDAPAPAPAAAPTGVPKASPQS